MSDLPPSRSPHRSGKAKTALVLALSAGLLAVIGVVFWHQDLRYSLPTPRPAALPEVMAGATVPLGEFLPAANPATGDARPWFLHFFNPGCPCSRFNLEHLRTLHQRFGDRARFVAVLQGEATPAELLARFRAEDGLAGMDAVPDPEGRLAAACGVYSTPQAALLSPAGQLLFRGNYNASRYCADPNTEFARLALEALLAGRPIPALPPEAGVAYGCELPSNLASATSAAVAGKVKSSFPR